VGTTREHDIGIAASNNFGGLANRLAGGRARRQAIEIGPLRVKKSGQMPGGHVRLLLHLELGIEIFQPRLGEAFEIDATVLPRFADKLHEELKILLSFAGAEIDAKAGGIEPRAENAGAAHGLSGSGDGKSNVVAAGRITRGVVDISRDVEVL